MQFFVFLKGKRGQATMSSITSAVLFMYYSDESRINNTNGGGGGWA